MTDITTTTQIHIHRFSAARSNVRGVGISASLEAITRLIGDAFTLAYLGPYTSMRHQSQVVSDDDLDGRDPSW